MTDKKKIVNIRKRIDYLTYSRMLGVISGCTCFSMVFHSYLVIEFRKILASVPIPLESAKEGFGQCLNISMIVWVLSSFSGICYLRHLYDE
jgi:hypothetical protein